MIYKEVLDSLELSIEKLKLFSEEFKDSPDVKQKRRISILLRNKLIELQDLHEDLIKLKRVLK